MTALLKSPLDLPSRGVVLTQAALTAADRLGLTARALARIVGLSEPTVSRMKRGGLGQAEGTKPYEAGGFAGARFPVAGCCQGRG